MFVRANTEVLANDCRPFASKGPVVVFGELGFATRPVARDPELHRIFAAIRGRYKTKDAREDATLLH